jgi:hypothetical protein
MKIRAFESIRYVIPALILLVLAPVHAELPMIELHVAGPRLPVTLLAVGGSITNFVLQRSDDLKDWHSILNVFPKVQPVRFVDRSTVGEIGETRVTHFYKTSFPAQSVQGMLDNWRSLGLTNYTFKFSRLCMCNPIQLTGKVSVKNGKVIAVKDADSGGQPIPNPDLSQFKSIEELFDILQTETVKADLLEVGFDEEFYFPTRIHIDYDLNIVDDEVFYEAEEVLVIP